MRLIRIRLPRELSSVYWPIGLYLSVIFLGLAGYMCYRWYKQYKFRIERRKTDHIPLSARSLDRPPPEQKKNILQRGLERILSKLSTVFFVFSESLKNLDHFIKVDLLEKRFNFPVHPLLRHVSLGIKYKLMPSRFWHWDWFVIILIIIPRMIIGSSLFIDVFIFGGFNYFYLCGPLFIIILLYKYFGYTYRVATLRRVIELSWDMIIVEDATGNTWDVLQFYCECQRVYSISKTIPCNNFRYGFSESFKTDHLS
jgi:hypothetical protein